jgi:large subunit ribosomal protein L4
MAYRTALSYRFGLSQLIMVTPMFLELPKTKLLKVLLRELKWGKNAGGGTLFININERANLVKAARVLGADVTVKTVREVRVRDLLLMGRVVIEKGALERLLEKYGVKDGSSRGNALRRDPIREYERLAKLL